MAQVLSPGWTASPARTVPLALPAGSYLRGNRTAAGPVDLVSKSAADVLDFALDVSSLVGEGGDELVGFEIATPIVDPATDLQVLWATILSGQPVFLLGGGLPLGTVTIQILLTTVAGRRRAENLQIAIDSNSPATPPPSLPLLALPDAAGAVSIPPNSVFLPDGSILTTDTGQPYLLA